MNTEQTMHPSSKELIVNQAADMAAMKAQIEALSDKVDALTRALLDPPPEGGPSFLSRATQAVVAWERGGWLLQNSTRLVLTIGGLAAAATAAKIGLWDWMGWNK